MRTAEEWGRLAVSLPGWEWMRGMKALTGRGNPAGSGALFADAWPDPDDPATAGCLLALLGSERDSLMLLPNGAGLFEWYNGEDWDEKSLPLGRACIAAAEALGRWPGGVG